MDPSHQKKTKIIATFGPACDSYDVLKDMVRQGVNVIRLNASHNSDPEYIAKCVELIRRVESDMDRPLGILLDLQGPKIRVGKFVNDKVELLTGQTFTLLPKGSLGDATQSSVSYDGILEDVSVGDPVYLDDGNLRLVVTEKLPGSVNCLVQQGGVLTNNKGINLPRTRISLSAFTEKDKTDIHLAVTQHLDYVALSFVTDVSDVTQFREYLDLIGGKDIHIIAKIERQMAIDNIAAIIDAADAVMVARGDLGVEIGIERVPEAQKMIIREANLRLKPVIVATQMLESMIVKRTATRAEASDVANAIYDRCDAVMLSAETAMGIDPANVVATMTRICLATDDHLIAIKRSQYQPRNPLFLKKTTSISFAMAANQIAEENNAKVLMAFSGRGETPLIISKLNPMIPVIAAADTAAVCRRVALYRGVIPLLTSRNFATISRWTDMINVAITDATNQHLVKANDTMIITAGIPVGRVGGTNSIRLITV